VADAFYWSLTTVLGGADKAPVSIGGKIVFVGHSIFALIVAATYTGAVAAFLISSSSESPLLSVVAFSCDFISHIVTCTSSILQVLMSWTDSTPFPRESSEWPCGAHPLTPRFPSLAS